MLCLRSSCGRSIRISRRHAASLSSRRLRWRRSKFTFTQTFDGTKVARYTSADATAPLVEDKTQVRDASTSHMIPHPFSSAHTTLNASFAFLFKHALRHFLPKNYPRSVSPSYTRFVMWGAAASVFSSASGVLATQSLLYAIGLGAGSIPLAAALNWIIKDGLGQLGGVAFASYAGNKFDADCKRWRFSSAVALDASSFLELLTPLFPTLFLPLASLANMGKNVSCIAASATKAGIHKSLALEENLPDVTAKAASQAIANSIVGTALGISLSYSLLDSTLHSAQSMACFGVLASLHLYSTYRSLSCVSLPYINLQRMDLLTTEYFKLRTTSSSLMSDLDLPSSAADPPSFSSSTRPTTLDRASAAHLTNDDSSSTASTSATPSPSTTSSSTASSPSSSTSSSIASAATSKRASAASSVPASATEAFVNLHANNTRPVPLSTPEQVNQREQFVRAYHSEHLGRHRVEIAPHISEISQSSSGIERLLELHKPYPYFLHVDDRKVINFVALHTAKSDDVLRAFFQIAYLSRRIREVDDHNVDQLLHDSVEFVRDNFVGFRDQLELHGWNTRYLFLEHTQARLRVHED